MSENKPPSVEDVLQQRLKEIFKVSKVVFDSPGESQEQGCLFIEVETARTKVKEGREVSTVTGNAIMFGQNDKLTIGFFSKAIDKAPAALKKPFFFYDFEENTKRFRNLVQRSLSFTFFFDTQYDPATGSIETVNFITEVNP